MARDQLVEKFGLLGGQNSQSKGWMNPVNSRARIVGGENRRKDGGPGKLDYTKLVRCTR